MYAERDTEIYTIVDVSADIEVVFTDVAGLYTVHHIAFGSVIIKVVLLVRIGIRIDERVVYDGVVIQIIQLAVSIVI